MNVSTRAVIYARVSGDDSSKEGRNLDYQLEMGREYAISRGYKILAELAEDDKGASGASMDLPQLNKVLDMAADGEFDVLIVRELDRLSRNLVKQLIVADTLNKYGVTIEYVLHDFPDNPDGRLNRNLFAMLAEYEREKISERNIRGRRNAVRHGKIMLHGSAPPYGYDLSDDEQTLVLNESEARIVKLIFEWYTQGDEDGLRLSSAKIADRLTEMHVPTWADRNNTWLKGSDYGEWDSSTVMCILHNTTYKGVWYYGKTTQPEENWIELEVPAIVSEEAWEAAQEWSQRNYIKSKRNTRHTYLMQHHLTCHHCGHKIGARLAGSNGNRYGYYFCNQRANSRKGDPDRCTLPYFPTDQVDTLVWNWVRAKLIDRQQLEAGLKELHQQNESALEPIQQELAAAQEELASNRAKADRLLDLYLDGGISKEAYKRRKEQLEVAIDQQRSKEARLKARIFDGELQEEKIQDLVDFTSLVSDRLATSQDFATRRTIIEILDVRGQLEIENGRKVVHLTCVLDPDGLSVDLEDTVSLPQENLSHPHPKRAPSATV